MELACKRASTKGMSERECGDPARERARRGVPFLDGLKYLESLTLADICHSLNDVHHRTPIPSSRASQRASEMDMRERGRGRDGDEDRRRGEEDDERKTPSRIESSWTTLNNNLPPKYLPPPIFLASTTATAEYLG